MKKSSKIAIIISSVLLIAIAVTFIVVLTTSISDKKYKINFYNDEAKAELIYSVEVKKDEEVAYDYNKYGNPEKAATQTNTYTFIGWADSEKTYRLNENLPKATKNTDYVAKFEENIRKYTIKFITDEGEELYQYSGNAGSMAEYGGIIPTKDSSIVYDYTFSGWNPELSVITEDKTYIAKFSETLRKYEVKFVDEDGLTVLSTKEYEYGSTPVFDGSYPEKADYEFVGWNMGDANYGIDDQLDIVDSDQTYIARYIMVVNVNYDSISVEMKESTRPNALVEFDMTVLPEDEVGELVFTFGNRVLPIYVNGVLQEHYTPLNGKYEAYISEDLKVYLTEPETVYQLILVINNVKSDPINLTLADGIWLTDELEIAKDTKLIFLDYTRGIVLDTKAKLDKDNKVNNDMIITESSKYIISIDQDNNEVLALSTIIPVVTDYYLLGSFNYYTESDSYKLTKEDELYTISLKLLKNDKLYIKLGSIIYNYESLAANELFAKDDNNYINTLFGGNYKLSFNPETSKITIALVDEFSVTIGENVYNLTLDKSDYSYEALYKVNLSCEKDSIISFNRGIFLEEDRETYLNNIKFVDSKYIVLKTIEDKTLYLKVTYQNTEFKYLVWLDGCPKDYSITYDLAGGTLAEGKSNPESYTIETESFTLNNPVKENYEFIGWTSDSISAPTLEVTVAKGSTGALSFTANYTPVEFTITYDLAGGALAEGKSNPEKYTVETESFTLNNPAKEGYNFVGWTSDDITTPTLEVIITLGSSGNLAFVANYEAIEYSITYDLAGGALAEGKSNPDKYTIETENFTLNNPLKENYEFIGWTYEGVTNPALEVVIEKGSIGELSFTANYTPVEFTITYDLAGGALAEGKSNPEKYTVETESFTLNNPSKSGYNFIGWTSTDITTPALEVVITLGSSGNLAFVANYEVIEYNISYNLSGGSLEVGITNPDKYTVETENFTLNNPLKENYEFIGWTYEGVTTPALEVVIEKGSIGDLSFTANYTPVEFTITYDLAGGALAEGKSNPEKYTVETESFTLNNPSKSGYNFIGWTSTDITTPALEVVITLGSSGNLAFVANYEVIEYNISYNLSGGSLEVGITNPDKYTVETENFTLNNPSKVNYDFIGWTSADITTPTIEVTIVKGSTGDLSFTANYTPTVFNITYNLKGGELEVGKSNPESYTVESVDFTLNNPIKTGCSFIGWTYNDITTPVVTVTIDCSETTGDIEFVANYEAITYTIEFNKNSESATGTMASMTLKYDEQKALSANNFAYTDMRFIGWATSNNGDVVYNPGQNVINLTATNNAVITLYAVWRNDIRKSSVLSSIKLKEGTDEIDNSTYTYDGYEKTPTVEIGIPETEYTVEYIDNISAGSATVRITGINTYDGVIDRTFKINEYEIALTWDEDEFVYNATTQTVIAKFTDVFGETRELVATAEQYNTSTSTYSPATFRDAGSYLLTATLEGDDAVNYKFRDTTSSDNYVRVNDYTAQKTYDLAKAKLTVNYGDIEFVYDGTQKSISNDNPTIISGLYGNDVVTITSISYADSERIDASSYKFECVLVGEAAGNYEAEDYLVITKKPVAIEWNTDSTEYDFVYSGSNKTVTARYQTVDNTYEYLTVTIRKDNYNVYFREAGTYNLSVNPFQGNYQFNDADKNRTYTISKKHLSIVWDNIDSENTVEMTYTSTSIDIGYSINGYVDGLIQSTVNYSPETPVNVGEYTCSLSIDISMTNYEIDDEITNVTLKVVPKSIKAVWSNTTKTYDSTALLPSVDLIFDGATDNPYPSDSSNLSVLATIEGGHTNAGLYTATAELSGLAKDNYVITTNETTQFNINKKVLTVRPNNVNLYLNASISAISNTFTYSCEGLVGGDTTNSVFSGEPSYIVKKSNGDLAPDTSSVVITYYIHILVNLVSPNYDVSPQPGELNFITKSLSNSEITLESNSYIFNNTEQKPNVTSVKIAQDTLDLNDDYVIVYPDNNLGDYINTGTYTIRVDGRGEYFGNYKDFEFTISSAELDDNLVSQSGSLTYTGSEQAATVTTVATHLDQTISYTYSANETGEYTSDVPGFTYADSYTVYYKATASNHSEATGQFVVTIAKADLYDMDLVFRYQTITTGPYVYGDSFMVNRLQSKVYTAQSVELANSNAGSYTLLDGPLTVGTHTYNVKYTPANENYNFFVKEETITMTYIVKYVLSGTQDSTSWSVVGERKTIMENMQDATYVIDYSDSSSYTPNKTYIDALFMMPLTITGYRIVPDVGNEYVVAAGSSITLNCNVTIYPYFDEIPTP